MEVEKKQPSYYSSDYIKKNEMGGACSRYGEKRGAYRVLVGKPEGRDQLARRGRRWQQIMKWVLK